MDFILTSKEFSIKTKHKFCGKINLFDQLLIMLIFERMFGSFPLEKKLNFQYRVNLTYRNHEGRLNCSETTQVSIPKVPCSVRFGSKYTTTY